MRLKRRTNIVRSAFVLDSRNLGHRVVRGASITFLGIALRTFLTIGSMSVLARLLTPADFGYIAMATVVTELAAIFGGFGFTNVLIQRRVINRLQLDTVFWAAISVGCFLALAVFSLSFFAAWFYKDPLTGELLRVLCITFLLNSVTNVHEAIVARLMRFKVEFFIQISSIAIRGLAAIGFAYYEFGVWSLVAGALTGSAVSLCCYLLAVPFRPRFRFNAVYLISNWKTSGSYFSSGFLYYINTNLDLILIGRFLGANALGYYQNARSLTDEIRGRIAMPLQRVLFPAFSAIQADRERLQQTVLRSARLLAAIIFPVGLGLSAVAEELVPVLYGDQWLAMIPVLGLFGVSAALRGATAISPPLFNSQNRVGLALKYSCVGTALMVMGILIGIPHGVVGVSIAVACSSLYSLVTFRAGLALIGLSVRHVIQVLGLPALAATVMWLFIAALRPISTEWIKGQASLLFVHVFVGGLVYSLTLHLFSRQYFRDFLDLGKKLRS